MPTDDDPNHYQHGGTHYSESAYQVWDFCALNAIPFLEGSAIKYVTRSRKKHPTPVEDIRKAIHFVEKIRSLYMRHNYVPNGFLQLVPLQELTITNARRLARENHLDELEEHAIIMVCTWKGVRDLDQIVELLTILRDRPTPAR